jgi:hypothetical protein
MRDDALKLQTDCLNHESIAGALAIPPDPPRARRRVKMIRVAAEHRP